VADLSAIFRKVYAELVAVAALHPAAERLCGRFAKNGRHVGKCAPKLLTYRMPNGPEMTEIEELKVKTRIADAELRLIERLRWGIAVLSAMYLEAAIYQSWTWPIIIGVVVLAGANFWHRRRYDAAWDAYEKATCTGKFAPDAGNDGNK
jgi:hypothetical protein